MKWFILLILLILLILFIFNKKENFTMLNSTPIVISETNPIYIQMLEHTKNKNDKEAVERDLRYFNNASHILFGLQRIPK